MGLGIRIDGDIALRAELDELRKQIAQPFEPPDQIQTILAATVRTSMDQECDPDGIPWPALSDAYQRWKDKVAPGAEMGRLLGVMKDEINLRGVPTISGNALTITYGVDPEAIAHAVKFTFGGIVTGTSQPPREFWGITAEAEAQLNDYFEARFKT